jgi:hypothetical protein
MKISENRSSTNWFTVLSVLGVIPPLGILMILTDSYRSRKFTFGSILLLLLGVVYTTILYLQVKQNL